MQPRSVFQLLVYTALIDGALQEEEKPILQRYGFRLGMSHAEMTKVLNEQSLKPQPPNSIDGTLEERQALFKVMTRVVLADDHVDQQEYQLVVKMGRNINLTEAQVEQYLRRGLIKNQAKKEQEQSLGRPVDGNTMEKALESVPVFSELGDMGSFRKTDFFTYLAFTALVDGVLHDAEKAILRKYAQRLGVPPQESIRVLNAMALHPTPPQTLPKQKSDREVLFRTMVKVVVADNVIADEQRDLLIRIGQSIDYGEPEVDALLQRKVGLNQTKTKTKTSKTVEVKLPKATTSAKKPKTTKQRRPRAEPEAAEAAPAESKSQSKAFVLAGAVAVLLLLASPLALLDLNKSTREGFKQRIAKLTELSSYRDYIGIKDSIEEFRDGAFWPTDKSAAEKLIQDLEQKMSVRIDALAKASQTLLEEGLENVAEEREADRLIVLLLAWKGTSKDAVIQAEASLKAALAENRRWQKLGQQVLAAAREQAREAPWTLHQLALAMQRGEMPELIDQLHEQLDKANKRGPREILSRLSVAYYHPLFDHGFYESQARVSQNALSRHWREPRRASLQDFQSRCTLLQKRAREYDLALKAGYGLLRVGDLDGALGVFERAESAKDPWFLNVSKWLRSDKARAWLRQRGLLTKPNKAQPQAKPPEREPEPKPEPKPVDQPAAKPESKPEAKPKPEAIESTDDDARNYKQRFVEALEQLRKAKGSAREPIVKELASIMEESQTLLSESPAMAYDVLRFYQPRLRKFRTHQPLTQAFDQHLRAAFEILLKDATGPSAFKRLHDLCKDCKDKTGLDKLEPYLRRFTVPKPGHAVYKREKRFRIRQAQVLETVESLLSQCRIDNARSLRRFTSDVRVLGLKTPKMNALFEKLVQTLIVKLGQDPSLARSLQQAYDQAPTRWLDAKAKAEAEKRALRKLRSIQDRAEDELIDSVSRAIKAREPGVGYDLLQLALIVNPQSSRAFKGMRYKKVDDQWLRPWDARLRRKGFQYDQSIGWYRGEKKDGQYFDGPSGRWRDLKEANDQHGKARDPWVFRSEHFILRSTAPLAETQEVLRRLEAFYLQLFRQFDFFFAPKGDAVTVFGLAKKQPLEVFYYNSRAQFLAHAKPGSQWAAGFYRPASHASYFYSMPGDWTTLQHEIVHQILGENTPGINIADRWLVEGTAVFMETAYFDKDGRLQLGTLDKHERPARYRKQLLDNQSPLSFSQTLKLITGDQWGSGDVSSHYTGAGAIVNFLMTFDNGRYRGNFLNLVRDSYIRNGVHDLEHYFGLSVETLDWLCQRYYKQGFVQRGSEALSNEQKWLLDADRIQRLYPDPDDKKARKAEAKESAREIDELLKLFRKGQNLSDQEQAIKGLISLGAEGKSAIRTALEKRLAGLEKRLRRALNSKQEKLDSYLKTEWQKAQQRAAKALEQATSGSANFEASVVALMTLFNRPFRAYRAQDPALDKLCQQLQQLFELQRKHLDLPSAWLDIEKDLRGQCQVAMDRLTRSDSERSLDRQFLDAVQASDLDESLKTLLSQAARLRQLMGRESWQYSAKLTSKAQNHAQFLSGQSALIHESTVAGEETAEKRCQAAGLVFVAESLAKDCQSADAVWAQWLKTEAQVLLKAEKLQVGLGREKGHWVLLLGRS